MAQKDLFDTGNDPDDLPDIPGLHYLPDYINKDQERRLITAIDQREWLTEIKRRVQHYGYRYGYSLTDKKLKPADAFPRWAANLSRKIVSDKLMKEIPDQLIVNEYEQGQGISPHVDHEELFGETIISISLGSACIMEFIHVETRDRAMLLLEPRSALVMGGDARHQWMHTIPHRKMDIYQGQKIQRKRRLSLTFRNVKKEE